jgi:lipoate-protein ligase A
MKHSTEKPIEQPKPFTPGMSAAAVRQHAFEMFRDKLPDHPLTLEDWVLAEKDLVRMMESEQS